MTTLSQIAITEIIYLIYNNLSLVIDKTALTCVNKTFYQCCRKTTYFILNKFRLGLIYTKPKRILFCINSKCLCHEERKKQNYACLGKINSNACWQSTFYYPKGIDGPVRARLSEFAKEFFGIPTEDGLVIDIKDTDEWYTENVMDYIRNCKKGTKITRIIPYCRTCTYKYVNFGSHKNGVCVSFTEGRV